MSNKLTHLTLPGDVEREIVDEKGRNAVLVQNTEPTVEGNKIWVNGDGKVRVPSWEEFQQKANKTQIDFDGANFKIGDKVLNYKELHDVHLVQPDFAFVVYGDRAYLLSYVQDDTNAMREMRFQSVIATTDAGNISNVKVSGIYVKSSDGVAFAGAPTIVDINSENKAYKATAINDTNKNNVWYPSNKAVADFVGTHTGNQNIHITAAERTTWNAKANDNAVIKKVNGVYTPDTNGNVSLYPDCQPLVTGQARNAIFRGHNFGTFTAATFEKWLSDYQVSSGKFAKADGSDALCVGDYFTMPPFTTSFDSAGQTKSETPTVTWMIAGFNTNANSGTNDDNGVNRVLPNHLTLIPRNYGFNSTQTMNPTSVTTGGYGESTLRTYLNTTLRDALKANGFGEHLLHARKLLSNAVNTSIQGQYSGYSGQASGWAWYDSWAELMSEVQVYGSTVWGGAFDTGEAYEKLPVFNFITPVQYGRGAVWLRSVASSAYFALVDDYGRAHCTSAAGAWLYVRPLIHVG